MSLIRGNFDTSIMGRIRADEYESRSGSENLDCAAGVSGDDDHQDADVKPPKKKRYHRHTPQQIQELEAFFKECPHPDEKRRLELSRRLNLETRQVKFWFQNRRTQMKTQLERHENMILKQENEKLQAENYTIKKAMNHPICDTCGGRAVLGEISYEEHHLKIENARLKDELVRICSLADKFLGKSVAPLLGSMPPQIPNSSLDLAVGRNGVGFLSLVGGTLPMGLDLGDDEVSNIFPMAPSPGRAATSLTSSDGSFLLDHALIAMHELIGMVEADSPLWFRSSDGGKEFLNHEEFRRKFNPPCLGPKPTGFITEATRETGMVNIGSLALVETLMDVDRWTKMFPYMIARSSIIEVISGGIGGTKNGALQLAELQILSPLVPLRKVKFLRFCKQHAEGVWSVVDVSCDLTREPSNANSSVSCRRLPSGCVVQDMPGGGYSKVAWVEHSDYDDSVIHHLYRPLISSGIGFGAPRWLATLQRQCDCLATLLAPGPIPPGITSGGREQMLNLARRMVDNFCVGVCDSAVHDWEAVDAKNLGPDMKVMTRTSVDNPCRVPPGVVLSATTSVWIPVPQGRLFDFLRDERLRSEWDILSVGGPMHEMINLPKGRERGNCVSLLHASTISPNQENMLILQETWTDESCSLVVYAPVDCGGIQAVMSGRESTCVALLPSGFAIVPDGRPGNGAPNSCNGDLVKGDCGGGGIGDGSGSLLTIGFQIVLNSLPTSNLTSESVQTVCNLISVTLQKIRDAVSRV